MGGQIKSRYEEEREQGVWGDSNKKKKNGCKIEQRARSA
jgi:hypothetical protein